jgi:hypothetical protein
MPDAMTGLNDLHHYLEVERSRVFWLVPHHVFCNTVIPPILLPAAISAKLLWVVEGIDCIEIKSRSSPFLLLIQRIPAA